MSDFVRRPRAQEYRVVTTVATSEQPSWQFMGVVFAGLFAILTGGFFGYQALMNGSISWRVNFQSPTDWGGFGNNMRAFLPVEGVAPQTAKYNAELRRKCVAPEVPGKRYTNLPRMVDYGTGHLDLGLRDGQRFMACVLDNEYVRLCQPSERRQVVLGLKKLAEMQAEEQSLRKASASRLPPQFLAAMQHASSFSGGDSAFDTKMTIAPELAEALKKASSYGFIKASDFGSSVPAELRGFIGPLRSDACR